ncbi:hypothetical protein HPO96_30330 [Kribbella sandramycini]|uniref:Uncharacterized protein n=1 Tax=Kribbella sandramycini TaxID=60450 RepID=A0A7Y4P1R6_9ACTN|nr:hypothetical protein [Kribbella sandramycini]MBB6566830.1 hypothetical protein [Kribbella sandramycini]NOL44552.1 hypothetical protein [Kribbella sandramycini]
MAGSHRAARGGGRAAAREVRRQKARKRNQTIAAGAAVVVLVGGGGIAALNAFGGDDSAGAKGGGDDKPSKSKVLASDTALLDTAGVKTLSPTGSWDMKTLGGGDDTSHVFVCQSQSVADASVARNWVRTFQNRSTKETAVQYVEVSNDATAAGKAYATIVSWFSGCVSEKRTRLSASYQTTGLGDRGWIGVFAQPSGPKTKYKAISITLAGQATVVVQHDSIGSAPPKPTALLSTTSAAVQKICTESGGCGSGTPAVKPSLLPTEPPGFMAPVDLPVLSAIDAPWVGTPARAASVIQCVTDPKKEKASKVSTQTYLAPDAKVPTEFGLDDTVARFASTAAASAYVSKFRKTFDGCQKNVSTAKVSVSGTVATGPVKGKAWEASFETGNGKKFKMRIGVAANGSHAVYLLYPVLPNLDISDSAFLETLTRAAERSAAYK